MARYVLPSSVGKSLSISDKYRRMSRILSRISMFTGQISSHALHDVHDHNSSDVMRSNTESAEIVTLFGVPTGGDTTGSPVAAITSPTFRTISRGSSGLPVAFAGHTDVHRPQIVHASVSKSCFQVKSSTVDAPNVSSSVSIRFGISRLAPFGRGRSFRYMFIGLVIMWRSIVVGGITRNARNAITCVVHAHRCRSSSVCTCQPSKIDEIAHPTNDHFSKLAPGPAAPRSAAIRNPSAAKPVTSMTANVVRMTRCSGLVLMRIRYGRCPY